MKPAKPKGGNLMLYLLSRWLRFKGEMIIIFPMDTDLASAAKLTIQLMVSDFVGSKNVALFRFTPILDSEGLYEVHVQGPAELIRKINKLEKLGYHLRPDSLLSRLDKIDWDLEEGYV